MQIITTHKGADFDAVASVLAANLLFPEAVAVLPRSLNPNVKDFLSIHKDVIDIQAPDEVSSEKVERLIIVDTNRWDRLDRLKNFKENENLDIFLWDHHLNEGDIEATWRCVEAVGATITLLVRVLKERKMELTPIQATLFLAGLYEDTGNLTFPSTTAEDALAAAYLLAQGADLNVLSTFLRPAYGEHHRNILTRMLRSAKKKNIGAFKISFNKQDINGHVNNLAVVVGMYREILNVDVVFGIFVDLKRGNTMVIGRSGADGFDVGMIMRAMGGGGHPSAGSALIKSIDPDVVEHRIIELIRGNKPSAIQISDLMSYPVVTVSPKTKMKQVYSILNEKGHMGLPVLDEGRLVGIISKRDFWKAKKTSALNAPVKAFMTPNVLSIEPRTSPMQAARLMIDHDIGRLPVVDNGSVIGIITRSDTMRYLYDLQPE
ncbi:MAG: CBS domain-containing protein [Desulfobacterales bacterium]|nr:CBS domain-containing protein [Desulfobacterales bacterium]